MKEDKIHEIQKLTYHNFVNGFKYPRLTKFRYWVKNNYRNVVLCVYNIFFLTTYLKIVEKNKKN